MYRFYETFPSLFFHPWSFHHSIKRKCLMSPFKKISEIFTYTWKCVYDRKIYIAENGMNIFPKRGFKEMLAQKNIVPWRAQKVPPPSLHKFSVGKNEFISWTSYLCPVAQWGGNATCPLLTRPCRDHDRVEKNRIFS